MSKVEGISRILSGVGRAIGAGGDDAARVAGRLAPRVGALGAAGAGAAGASWLVSSLLSGTNRNVGNTGPGSGNPTTMGGGGLSGSRPGVASSRGFTPPANDNSKVKVSYNPNGDYEGESLKLAASSANSLSSIDNTVKNILKFSVAKATWDTRSLRELSIESAGSGADNSAAIAAAMNAGRGGDAAPMPPALMAGMAAIAGGLYALSKLGGGSFNIPGIPNAGPPAPGGGNAFAGALHQGGMALTGASYAGDARRLLPRAGAVAAGQAANDNSRGFRASVRSGVQQLESGASRMRLASTAGSMARGAAGRGVGRVVQFLRGLKATPVGRFPYVTSVLAAIDPVLALVESGGQVNGNVKKQVVGAIATIIAGPAGIAAGAALGAFIGIPATPVGMAVGAILGGIGGAIAALSAEFVAEQIYDLVAGNITLSQFGHNVGRGAMNGIRNTAAIAGGAIIGGAVGAFRFAKAGVAAAPAVARAGWGLAAPTGRSVAGLAVGVGGGGAALVAMQPKAPAASSAALPTALQMSGSELHTAARTAAEQYLGRGMTSQEWQVLLRAVYAESGRGGAGRENAMIMATILNRARNTRGYAAGRVGQAYLRQGLTVLAVLYGTNQFQAVTGAPGNRRPSSNFTRGPNHNELEAIFRSVVQFLHKVPHGQVAFTAASASAYGRGTNIGYRDTMLQNGGIIVGGTVFNAGLMGENQAQTSNPAAAPAVSPSVEPVQPNQSIVSRLGGAFATFGTKSAVTPTSTPTDEGASAGTGKPGDPNTLGEKITKGQGVNIDGLRTNFKAKLSAMAEEYTKRTRKKFQVNSGFRTRAQQEALYRKYGPGRAALPGRSRHESGMAVDIQSSQLNEAASMGLLSKYGFHRPVRGEAWHLEMIGSGGSTPAGTTNHASPRSQAPRTNTNPASSYEGATESEGTAPTTRMSSSVPAARQAENIASSSIAAEKRRTQITITNPAGKGNTQQILTKNEKTDSSAPESVVSPVMSAYQYAAYWGVD